MLVGSEFSQEDAADCARWILSDVADRVASKHQKAPLFGESMARWAVPKYLRGSDLSERLYASFQVLKRAGYGHRDALLMVTDSAKKFLRKSRRGRPRLKETGDDYISTIQSVRSRVNAFARRKLYAERASRFWVGQFLWSREIGVIKGSEFDPDSCQRMFEDRLAALRQMRLCGFVWPTPPPRAGRFDDPGS